jgi:hypothetical protein
VPAAVLAALANDLHLLRRALECANVHSAQRTFAGAADDEIVPGNGLARRAGDLEPRKRVQAEVTRLVAVKRRTKVDISMNILNRWTPR